MMAKTLTKIRLRLEKKKPPAGERTPKAIRGYMECGDLSPLS
jgi:hypothetical protein